MSVLADLEVTSLSSATTMTPSSKPQHQQSALLLPPTETPTTDLSALIDQKENIRPLSTGRSASTLSELFTKDRSEAERQVAEGHRRWRELIEECNKREEAGEEMPEEEELMDVLDPYVRYVAFVNQHHPSSHAHLLPLLESTTRKFINDARFAQDLRYLKLWAQYAQLVGHERREDVWVFLNSREVGTRHALFYEEWAASCEARGRREKADEAFRIGIARKAQPLKRLQTNYQAFQARPAVTLEQQQQSEEATTQQQSQAQSHVTPGGGAGGRKVLGARSAGGAVVGMRTPSGSATSRSVSGNGARLDIFVDGPVPGAAATTMTDDQPGAWEELGTREGNRKENTVEAVGWKGETLPQSKTAAARIAPRTPKMEVFKDNGAKVQMRSADEQFSRGRMTPHEAEALRADPLRFYDLPAGATAASNDLPPAPAMPKIRSVSGSKKASSSASASSSTPSGAAWTMPEEGRDVPGKNGKVERRMIEWDQVFRDGDEWSFEEIRARRAGLARSGRVLKAVEDWERNWHQPGASTPRLEPKRVAAATTTTPPKPLPAALPVAEKKRVPSPTVNTKAAMADVYELFNQTVNAGGARRVDDDDDSDDSDSDSDSDDDDDDDLHTQAGQPTPLPPPSAGHFGMAMPNVFATPGSLVPPTPTPAQGYMNARKPASGSSNEPLTVFADENATTPAAAAAFKPMVFQDENAIVPPSSASRSGVFGATPAKAPGKSVLTEKTPLKVFKDKTDSVISETPVPTRSGVFGQSTPSSSSVKSQPARRGVFGVSAASIAEENEDDYVQQQHHQEDNGDDEEGEYNARRVVRCGGAFDLMTPITERTCEFTSSSQAFTARSSISGAQAMRQRALIEGDSDEEEEDNAKPNTANLPSVKEEENSSARSERTSMPPTDEATMPRNPGMLRRSSSIDRSGSVDSPFALSPGHTIHRQVEDSHVLTALPETSAASSGLKLSNPCCPTEPEVVQTLLDSLSDSIALLPGFVELRTERADKLEGLQRHAKSRVRRNSSTTPNKKAASANDAPWMLDLAGRQYEIEEKIGEGGFGAVFKAIDLLKRQELDDASDDEEEDVNPEALYTVAIKVEKPANLWEAIILDRVRSRLAPELHSSVIRPRAFFAYQDETMLLLDYQSQGTLLDTVNKAQNLGIASLAAGTTGGVEEILAIFFTIELLRLVEALHRADFIHGDLKIDNCMIRLEDVDKWSAQYDASGAQGWSSKGIRVIDFGRAIDLQMYPAKQRQEFIADWPTDTRDCQEMRDGRPWSHQADYHGLASICYCMLFGKYISTEVAPAKAGDGDRTRYRIQGAMKRYWQADLWNSLFDLLLNPKLERQDAELPLNDDLARLRSTFEDYLEANCSKGGKSLKGLLTKIELATMSR